MNYLAGPSQKWIHPDDTAPPRGSKILMLNRGGVLAMGLWMEGMAVWMPLPELDGDMKVRLLEEGRLI